MAASLPSAYPEHTQYLRTTMFTAMLLLAFALPKGENFYRAAKQGDWFEIKTNDVWSCDRPPSRRTTTS